MDSNKITGGFLGLEKSLAWATDENFTILVDKIYRKVITSLDDRPYFLVAYDALSEIVNYNARLNAAYQVQDKLKEYWKTRLEEDDYKIMEKEFDSLIHYLQILDGALSIEAKLKDFYRAHSDQSIQRVDSVVYFMLIKLRKYQDEFLWFSQAHYHYAHVEKKALDSTSLPLYVFPFKGKIVPDSAIRFCQSLLEGWHFTNRVFHGNELPPTTIKEFPVSLRNYCFDEYIRLRAAVELDILSKDNERDYEADLDDAKIELLKKEVAIYKEAQAGEIDPETLKMAAFFIKHLKIDLGLEKPDAMEIDPSSEEYNIPNLNSEIDKRIKAVYKAKVCKYKADWGAVFKLWIEDGTYKDTECEPAAERINKAIGKKGVTTASAIRQSPALSIIQGKWNSKEGWTDRVHNRRSGNLLNRYVSIARAYSK